MEQPKLYDWLIVVFLHEIQMDTQYSDAMKQAIENAGGRDNIVLFLVEDSFNSQDNVKPFRLKLYRLMQEQAGDWAFEEQLLPQLNGTSKKSRWETAFRYIYSNFTGERNMLITYSEGAAFAINVEQGGPAAGVQTNPYYILDDHEISVLRSDPDFSPDGEILRQGDAWLIKKDLNRSICKNLEVLWVSELARALDGYLYGQNVDVLLMTNCFMQLFDNGYNLSNKVKFLVGAEGTMDMRGYDYGKLMTTLNKTPAISEKALVTQVITDLTAKYQQEDPVGLFTNMVFANRLKFYPLALRVFEDLLEELTPLLPKVAGKLASIRAQTKNVSRYPNFPLIDAGLWIKLVTQQVTELKDGARYFKLFSELQAKITVKDSVSPLVRTMDAGNAEQYGYTGISLYFPADNQMHDDQKVLYCAGFNPAIPAPFRSHSKWNVFLDRYFKALAAVQAPQPQAQPVPA